MKIFLSVALVLIVIIVSGCGSKYSDETFLQQNASWVETKENVDDFMDAAGRGNDSEYDEEFLMQQFLDGKIKSTDKEIKIAVTDELRGGKVVEIKFLQGRYKNKVGYTFPEFIIDVGKERELKKKLADEKKAAEEKRLAGEKEKFKQLANQISQSSDITQIACTMAQGTDAYQKLIGITNLPEGTPLKITLAGVKKETTVLSDKTFYALFERSIIPVGEQNISISTPDKEIYTGKIDVQ